MFEMSKANQMKSLSETKHESTQNTRWLQDGR